MPLELVRVTFHSSVAIDVTVLNSSIDRLLVHVACIAARQHPASASHRGGFELASHPMWCEPPPIRTSARFSLSLFLGARLTSLASHVSRLSSLVSLSLARLSSLVSRLSSLSLVSLSLSVSSLYCDTTFASMYNTP